MTYKANNDVIVIGNHGAKFINQRLDLWFNLAPDPENDGKNWYAGSATSVLLDGKEELDPFTAEISWLYLAQDREKRCMQVDWVQLWDRQARMPVGSPINIYDRPYELLSESTTAEEVAITIASAPFEQDYPGENGTAIFRLHRTIRLHRNSDLLTEELSIRKPENSSQKIDTPYFTAHYFSYIAFHSRPEVYWNPDSPNYFAVGCSGGFGPFPGYGFASDVDIMELNHPANDFPYEQDRINTFAWKLAPCKLAKCLHLFMRYEPHNFGDRVKDSFDSTLSIGQRFHKEVEHA
jgi:hypothetical protein